MRKSVFYSHWFYVLMLLGYPLVAAITSLLGQAESSAPSIIFRLGMAIWAIIIIGSVKRPRSVAKLWTYLFFVFWLFYFARIFLDAFIIVNPYLPLTGLQYFAYALTFSFLPAVAAFRVMNTDEAENIAKKLIYFGIVVAIFVLLDAWQNMQQFTSDETSERLAGQKLNSIGVGHLGASLALIAIYWLRYRWIKFAPSKYVSIFGIALGVTAMVGAASKGAIVAFFIAAIIFYVLPIHPRKLLFLAFLVLPILFMFMQDENAFSGDSRFLVVARMASLLNGDNSDASTSGRLEAYHSAWSQFVASPIFGDSLIENTLHTYPHNSVLESLMATGIIGGAGFVVMTALFFISACKLLIERGGREWIGILGIQWLVGGLFSGGLWGDSLMWFMMALSVFAVFGGIKYANQSSAAYGANLPRRIL